MAVIRRDRHVSRREQRQNLVDLVVELNKRVTDLEGKLQAMEAEVRTQRLVVVEEDGFERVLVHSIDDNSTASAVQVFARPKDGDRDSTFVGLYALNDDDTEGEQRVGVDLWGEGECYLSLDIDRVAPSPILGDSRFRASVDIHGPTGVRSGVIIDGDGLKLSPNRLYDERHYREIWEKEIREARIKRGLPVPDLPD